MTSRQEIASYFREYGPMVYRRALILLGDPSQAKDAAQEVFVRAFRSADRFEHRASVSTWLYQITTNYCLNQIRDRARRGAILQQHAAGIDLLGAPSPEDLVLVRQLLAEADARQAEVALHVYVDGMSREEVAETLQISVRTVGNLLARFQRWARERLVADSGASRVEEKGAP